MDDELIPCAVSDCPAMALPYRETCGPHAGARLAKALGITSRSRCILCGRIIRSNDWVWREMRMRAKAIKRKPGHVAGYAHVACEPRTARVSKKAIRASVKPLFTEQDG